MQTSLRVLILTLACGFAVACSSNKPKEAADARGSGGLTGDISNDPLAGHEGSDSGKIQGLSTIHFELDRAVVSGKEKDLLKQNAEWIKKHTDVKIQIEGHCDERGSVEYNLALGERRARAVADALMGMGIPKARLTTISYGEERPIATGSTEEAYAQNRRANFVPLKADQPAPPLAKTH